MATPESESPKLAQDDVTTDRTTHCDVTNKNTARAFCVCSVTSAVVGFCLVLIVIYFRIVPSKYGRGVVYTSCYLRVNTSLEQTLPHQLIPGNGTDSPVSALPHSVPVLYEDYYGMYRHGRLNLDKLKADQSQKSEQILFPQSLRRSALPGNNAPARNSRDNLQKILRGPQVPDKDTYQKFFCFYDRYESGSINQKPGQQTSVGEAQPSVTRTGPYGFWSNLHWILWPTVLFISGFVGLVFSCINYIPVWDQ